jgi:uncharacterized RDD family membrane protein YckC
MLRTGVGTRVMNFLVDTTLIFFISYGLYKWWLFYVQYWGQPFVSFYMFFYCTVFVYYFLFELIAVRTPGKYITMTKVVTIDNKRPGLLAIFLRSILRLTLIDPFFIGLWEKPLHDKLSKTEVVEA